MKVLKEGIWWKFKCKGCQAICQADPEDATERPMIDHEGDTVGYIPVVECGQCGQQHDIPKNKINPKVEEAAKRNRKIK